MKNYLMKISLLFVSVCSLISMSTTTVVSAHSGGTDAAGCHSGSQPYHCHSGSSYSPYKAPSNPYKVPSYNYTPPTIKPYKVPSYNYTPPTIKPYKVPSYKPSGPTALCGDYTLSYSKSRSGACSGHRGVLVWAG